MFLTWLIYFLWCVTWLLWTLETQLWIIWMTLCCHHLCVFYTLFMFFFWLMVESNLVNITDPSVSKYVSDIYQIRIPATVPLLPCIGFFLLYFVGYHIFLWWPLALSLLLGCSAYFFVWFIFPHLQNILPYAGHCFCGCVILQYLEISNNFLSFAPSFCCWFWPGLCPSLFTESKSFASNVFLILLSMPIVLLPSEPRLTLDSCLPHWYPLEPSIVLLFWLWWLHGSCNWWIAFQSAVIFLIFAFCILYL